MLTATLPSRRQLLRAGALLLGLSAAATAALAQAAAWPEKPITLIVPFATGGTTDVLARALSEPLGQLLGQTVIVDNRPGAGATLGAGLAARAQPDGHTLLMGAVHHTIATSVYRSLPYDFQQSFAPVSTVAVVPNVLVINADTPARNPAELVALARQASASLAYGSNGHGTLQHIIGTQFATQNGIELLHVPYKGSGPLTTDLIGGQVAMSFDTVTPVLPHIQSGRLRALAVTTAQRSSVLPDTPTLNESGLKDFDLGTWFGVLAPAATPPERVERLNQAIVTVIRSPAFLAQMSKIGAEPIGDTPAQMGKRIADDTRRFAAVVQQAGIRID